MKMMMLRNIELKSFGIDMDRAIIHAECTKSDPHPANSKGRGKFYLDSEEFKSNFPGKEGNPGTQEEDVHLNLRRRSVFGKRTDGKPRSGAWSLPLP